jgi:hypothetical protein
MYAQGLIYQLSFVMPIASIPLTHCQLQYIRFLDARLNDTKLLATSFNPFLRKEELGERDDSSRKL